MSRHKFYRLVDRMPVPIPVASEADWLLSGGFEAEWALVAKSSDVGPENLTVTTYFLVLDHAITGEPILFETMTVDAAGDVVRGCVRSRTWEEAEAAHRAAEHFELVN